MDVYMCDNCGYYYDPEYDDDEASGVPFSKLPSDWVCPECGAPKKDFYKVEDDEDDDFGDYEDDDE